MSCGPDDGCQGATCDSSLLAVPQVDLTGGDYWERGLRWMFLGPLQASLWKQVALNNRKSHGPDGRGGGPHNSPMLGVPEVNLKPKQGILTISYFFLFWL